MQGLRKLGLALLAAAGLALSFALPASASVGAYGPLGGLHPCTATSITCQGDSLPPSPWKLTSAVSFRATNISGGWAFRTSAPVVAGEHLICAGHPTNVTSVSGEVFRVSPRLNVPGGATVTCLVN